MSAPCSSSSAGAADQRFHAKKRGAAAVQRKRSPSRTTAARGKTARSKAKLWSGYVTEHSDALDLEEAVFTLTDPHQIALSLKRSAESSTRRKGTPYQSAMSMLTFYINRGGKGLAPRQRRVLERAKGELRKVFGRSRTRPKGVNT